MTAQTITETTLAVNNVPHESPMTPAMTALLTERRNRLLREEGEREQPSCQVWWVVLVTGYDETRPSRAHWCYDEAHAEQEAASYRAQGRHTHICATFAA